MVTARLPGPVLLCLAARPDGPDHPPYLCQRPEGHGGFHRVSEPDLFVWEWPNTAAPSNPATPEQLAEAATPGPWTTDEDGCCVYAGMPDDPRPIAHVVIDAEGTEADAAFIAAARDLVPRLLARVRALTDAGDVMAARLSVAIDEGHNIVPDATDDQAALIEAFAIEAVAAWDALVGNQRASVTRNDHGDELLYHGGPLDGRPFTPYEPVSEHDANYALRLDDHGMILGAWWDPPINPPPYGATVSDA